MTAADVIQNALAGGRHTLTEAEAKTVLAAYGIPVVRERTAPSPEAAAACSDAVGYPVVLKALGSRILHKTERRLVLLNLSTPEAVLDAARAIARRAGEDLEGFLIQPYLTGARELVAGIFRDRLFGPMILFGVGGILTEALADVAMRRAPLEPLDAAEMLDDIRAAQLFGPFRGESPANRERLVETLVGLARLAAELAEVAELDINPLKLTPSGDPVAVDALIRLTPTQPAASPRIPVPPKRLGHFFHPDSIAFVGASARIGKWGHMLFTLTASGGFEGRIYLVNAKGGTIADRPAYRSVLDIPDPVDLAVVTVPADAVLDLIPQLQQKGIGNMLLVTSGFSETGEAGRRLENRLMAAARDAGILIIGPNTMGICNPHIHLYCTGSHVRPRAGSTAVVAQSGNMGTQLLAFAEREGIGIRGFCGSGNEAMVTVEDFLAGFEDDLRTRTVMLYLESIKSGDRFFESACRVGRKKPIVLLKGGRSDAGYRAAASHTGALSSDVRVFDAVCRQAGIVQVVHSMDMLDLAAAFASLPLPKGDRVAILTLGGGWGVVTADLCADFGLALPELAPPIVTALDRLLPPYWSRANPVDIVGERDMTIPKVAVEQLVRWDGCDAVIHLGIVGRQVLLKRLLDSVRAADPTYSDAFLDDAKQAFVDFETDFVAHTVGMMNTHGKPVIGVRLMTEEEDLTVDRAGKGQYRGVFYPTPERAVKALSKMVEYRRFLDRQRDCPIR